MSHHRHHHKSDDPKVQAYLDKVAKRDHRTEHIFRRILHVIERIIATITLFSAVAQWNSYRDTLYYTLDENLRSLQYIVMQIIKKAEGSNMIDRKEMMELFHGNASAADPVSLRMAITICTVLPIIMVYPFLQKHFMKGMMIGSMKG